MFLITLHTGNWLDYNDPETLTFWSLIHSIYTDHLGLSSLQISMAMQFNRPLNYKLIIKKIHYANKNVKM